MTKPFKAPPSLRNAARNALVKAPGNSALTKAIVSSPAKVDPRRPVRGRYHLYKLLRKLISLPPAEQHAVLLQGEFTLEESISLCKAFNGAKYHKARRENIMANIGDEL